MPTMWDDIVPDGVLPLSHRGGVLSKKRCGPLSPSRRPPFQSGGNIGGNRHLVIDIACTHEFCGNHLRDVSRNGQLRDPGVNKLLETTACTKVALYREAYASQQGTTYAFLPCVMSTSGRIHGEFLRLSTSLPTGTP